VGALVRAGGHDDEGRSRRAQGGEQRIRRRRRIIDGPQVPNPGRVVGGAYGHVHRRGGALPAADAQDAPIFLEVRTDNEPAMALYHSYGFVTIGVRRGYYMPSGADACTMLRPRLSEKDGAEP